jgi:hypothetical protein
VFFAGAAVAAEKVKPRPARARSKRVGKANLCRRYFEINFIITLLN